MQRIFNLNRLFPWIIVARRLATTYDVPRQISANMNDDDQDDQLGQIKSPEDYIFADSKSARYKEKNKRKQKKWAKILEERKFFPKTPLSSFEKEPKQMIQDSYVAADGTVREADFISQYDQDFDRDETIEDKPEPKPLSVTGNRYPIWYYAGKLQKLASENKVLETLDYFYNVMMDKERVAPNLFCYQIVIGICARNGYLKQTFDLYREMKDRGFTTVDSRKMSKIFTLLATGCYRASDSKMAIAYATQFVDEMREKNFRIEYRTFNALIAAFGKHHGTKMAFQLADEMVEVGFIPNEDTYASLLIACNGEKTSGFKYAIEIWRRMRAFNVRPTPFHFGLLLKITKNCGLGSTESLTQILMPPSEPKQLLSEIDGNNETEQQVTQPISSFLSSIIDETPNSMITMNESSNEKDCQNIAEITEQSTSLESKSEWWQNSEDILHGTLSSPILRPFIHANILKPNIFYEEKNLVALRMPRSATERLMLLGGIPGILKHMQECRVEPTPIIFNGFLNLIPSQVEHEEALIQIAQICRVKLDLSFYNILIHRRVLRRVKSQVVQALEWMREQCLVPDEFTFSALAKGCENRVEAEQLLEEMNQLNLKPNQKILDAMLPMAFQWNNFPLLSLVCESYRTYQLPINEESLHQIEKYLLEIRTKILTMEKVNVDSDAYRLLSTSFDRFEKFYKNWLRTVSYAKRFDQKLTFRFEKPDLKK